MSTPASEVPIQLQDLRVIVERIVGQQLGYDEKDRRVITDILMWAQIRGNSQGVIKLITSGVPPCPDVGKARVEVEYETKLSARLHGHDITGMVVMNQACDMAIAKAKEHGFGMVATHHSSSGTGSIGYFGHKIAEEGLLGFVFSQSPEFVAPFGSYEPIFGTNPFSIGVPTMDNKGSHPPLVLDMATSAYAWYAVKEAFTAGRAIPDDVAYDPQGKPTTDPGEALKGALRVFDRSYKGSHIALMVEILAGALAGGEVEDKHARRNWGNLVFAIDPELLGPVDDFQAKVQALLKRVREAKRLEGVDHISLPGERSEARAATAQKRGTVLLEANMYKGLMDVYQALTAT